MAVSVLDRIIVITAAVGNKFKYITYLRYTEQIPKEASIYYLL